MDMNRFAKENDLARKFEKAIESIDVGNAWAVFAGLDKGETQVKVTFDGQVRFHPVKKPRRRVKKEHTAPEKPKPDTHTDVPAPRG